jgi:D-alanine-D-alanine ligase
MPEKIRVGVVFGGRSAEHEVSLQSAKNVLEAMDKSKYEPVLIGIDREGHWHVNEQSTFLLNANNFRLTQLNKPREEVALIPKGASHHLVGLSSNRDLGQMDVIFPVLHGPYGEDGSVQGLFKLANLPFVGAGILGSALAMDKDVMKRLLRDAGIPIARFIVLNHKTAGDYRFEAVLEHLGLPVFVKPANLGSSVGVSKVRSKVEYVKAIETAFEYDTKILIEEYIAGREIECSVLGNLDPIASLPGEVLPQHEFYSYEAKYIDENGAILEIPAKLDQDTVQRIQDISIRAFKTLCCEGMARVDMFLKDNGDIVLNEINTIPGFTRISMYPKLWEVSGISYGELIDRLIQLAIERFKVEQRLRTSV